MSNLISRQAAIDALEREKSLIERPITEIRWFDLGLGKAQDVLSELPSAERWIPCSEGLPKDRSKTWVTTEWDYGDRTVEYATYWDDYIQWGPITENVVAWMLSPMPWKGEKE